MSCTLYILPMALSLVHIIFYNKVRKKTTLANGSMDLGSITLCFCVHLSPTELMILLFHWNGTGVSGMVMEYENKYRNLKRPKILPAMHQIAFNPWHALFSFVYIQKYFCFQSYLKTDMVLVFESQICGRRGPVYPAKSIPSCWWPVDARSQGISSHGIDLVLEYCGFSTSKIRDLKPLLPF